MREQHGLRTCVSVGEMGIRSFNITCAYAGQYHIIKCGYFNKAIADVSFHHVLLGDKLSLLILRFRYHIK